MIDFIKFDIKNTELIQLLTGLVDDYDTTPKINMFEKYHLDKDIQITVRNIFENGQFLGVGTLWLSIRPHNIFNKGLHNGNDFRPLQCVETFRSVFSSLGICENKYNELRVVNLEFGVNVVLPFNVRDAVNGFLYHKKTPFVVNKYPYNKITEGKSRYKKLKVYAKGIQMLERGIKGIAEDTLRFEIKSNESKNIRKYGLHTATDIFNPQLFDTFQREIMREFDLCLWADLKGKNQFKSYSKESYWSKQIHKTTYNYHKSKYQREMMRKGTKYYDLYNSLRDKCIELFLFLNSIDGTNSNFYHIPPRAHVLKVENRKLYTPVRRCKVTGLDISMQKESSLFLCNGGIKWYYENDNEVYQRIMREYLPKSRERSSFDEKVTELAHSIRNKYNRTKERYKKMYPLEQYQLFDVI